MPFLRPMSKSSVILQATREERFKSSAIDLFKESTKEALGLTTPSAIHKLIRNANEKQDENVIPDKDEFKKSKNFRENVEFFNGMTEEQADTLAKASDERKNRDFIFSHSQGRIRDFLSIIGGGFVGSAPDPVNFIPIVGPLAKLSAIARATRVASSLSKFAKPSTIARRALLGSTEAGTNVALTQPLIVQAEKSVQGDYDWKMSIFTVGFALGIGGTFGTIAGALKRLPLKQRGKVARKVMDDAANDRKPDIEPVLRNDTDKISFKEKTTELEKVVEERNLTPFAKSLRGVLEGEPMNKLVLVGEGQEFVKIPVSKLNPEIAAIVKEELNLIRNELVSGKAPERFFEKDDFNVITGLSVERSTNPPYLFDELSVVGLKQGGKTINRRSKKTVINAVEDVLAGKEKKNNTLHEAIKGLVEDRIKEDKPRFEAGSGTELPRGGNNVLQDMIIKEAELLDAELEAKNLVDLNDFFKKAPEEDIIIPDAELKKTKPSEIIKELDEVDEEVLTQSVKDLEQIVKDPEGIDKEIITDAKKLLEDLKVADKQAATAGDIIDRVKDCITR